MRLWDVKEGQARNKFDHTGMVNAVAYSPDGLILATGSGELFGRQEAVPSEVRLWDVKTGRVEASLAHPQTVRSLAFSPDGLTLATGSGGFDFLEQKQLLSEVLLWDVKTKRVRAKLDHPQSVNAVAWTSPRLVDTQLRV